MCCSSVDEWKSRYKQYWEAGLIPEKRGPKHCIVTDIVSGRFAQLVETILASMATYEAAG